MNAARIAYQSLKGEDRLEYDKNCDRLICYWRIKTNFDINYAEREDKIRNKTNKYQATRDHNRNLSSLMRCIHLFRGHRKQETNQWRLEVIQAHQDGNSSSKISREIRKVKGSRNWDGVANNCKEYKAIYQKVIKAVRVSKTGSLDQRKIDELDEKEKKKVLKNTKVTNKFKSSEKRRKRVGDEQYDMELNVYHYIIDLRRDFFRVTRLIVFRRVMELLPGFLGGIKSPNFFKEMKNWFYYSFANHFNLSVKMIAGASRKLPPDWEEKCESIIRRVAKSQEARIRDDGVIVPKINDNDLINTDHIPTKIEPV